MLLKLIKIKVCLSRERMEIKNGFYVNVSGGGEGVTRNKHSIRRSEDKLCKNKLLEFDESFKTPSSDEEKISL